MASEIVFLITEQRNKQRITLPAGSYRFGRSAQCEYVLRRNNVGEVQFVVACTKDGWTVTDSSTECATWYDNRYLNQGETCPLQEGDVLLIRSADVPLLKFHGPVLLSGHKCVYNAIITTLL